MLCGGQSDTNCGWPVVFSGPATPVYTDRAERADLIALLENWRREHGYPAANLKGRSMARLRKMRSEAERGNGHRLGRTWKRKGR